MMKVPTRRLATCLAVAIVAPFACDSRRDKFANDNEREFAARDASAEASAAPACASAVRCSRDLHAIVDACDESRIVESCPPDQGCAYARCVPACDATVSSAASVGCEFATLPPSRYVDSEGSCFAAFIANTWTTPTPIEAEYAGKPLDLTTSTRVVRASGESVTYEPFTGELQPGEVAVLFLGQSLSAAVPCPEGVTPAVPYDTSIYKTGRGSSFRIKTSVPVSAYSMFPFGGAKSFSPSATLLLPVPAWKASYVVMNAWEQPSRLPGALPTTQVIAAEDDTEVTVVGSLPIQAGTNVESAEQGVPHVYRLHRGDVLQFAQNQELTGSRIAANKGVAVFGGHGCMNIPAAHPACDSSQLQLFPVHSWGRESVAVPHLSRRADGNPESYFYAIVAAVDGTVLTYEPARPTDAPATLAAGESVRFLTSEPFVVRSQDEAHPVAVYAYMSGSAFSKADRSDGDPEFTNVIPSEQFLDRYIFYSDTTYRNSHLVIVRSRPEGKEFQPVVLDCGGPLDGWKPVGTQGKYEFVRVQLVRDFIHQKVGTGTCGPGRHEIDSLGPFSVTVWGTDRFASYGYPGGAAIRTLNSVDPIVH
jgi:IgGFc binding protein